MKKVLFITPSLCQGGIEHSMITMLKLLNKTKYELTLFTYLDDMTLLPLVPKEVRVVTDKEKPHYHRKLKAVFYKSLIMLAKALRLKNLRDKLTEKHRKYIHSLKVKHPAKDIFKNDKFDVVVSNAIGIATEMALCFEGAKYYVFYRSSMPMHLEMLSVLLPQYDGIIGVSDGVKNMLYSNYSGIRDKVQVIKNYVDAQRIVEKSKEHIEVDNSNRLMLCTCGRLSEEKGFELAVEAAHILKEKVLDFVWYFVGDGAERKKVEDFIERYNLKDSVIITGYKDNPFPYISKCDLYVQPSLHESYGRTIKEAVILGKPVVSTDTFGGHTVLNNGEYGEIVEISPKGIADGIIKAIEKDKLGVYKKYDINENIREREIYVQALEELLDR